MTTYRRTKEENRGRRIFLANLAPFTRTKTLVKIFQEFQAEHAVVNRRPTGTIGFVTFPSATQASNAIGWARSTALTIHKRAVTVKPADPWHETNLIQPRPRVDPFPGRQYSPPLPPEVVTRIARYLRFRDRAIMECVCRSWRTGALASYATDKVLDTQDWRWPDGWEHKRITTEAFYWAVRRLGPYVTTLRCDDRNVTGNLRPQVLAIATRNCPFLSTVDLTGATIRPTALRDLKATAATLRELRIGRCQAHFDVELSSLFSVARNLEIFAATGTEFLGRSLPRLPASLRELTLDECPSLLPASVGEALASARSLVSLELSRCHTLTSDEPLTALFQNTALHATLVRLRLIVASFHPDFLEDLPDELGIPAGARPFYVELNIGPAESPATIPSLYRQLEELTLMFCGWVSNSTIIDVGEYLRSLRELDISGCANIRGQFALDPLGRIPALRKLSMSNLHPSVGAQVWGSIPGLEEIHCRDNAGITDEDVCGAVTGCPNLRGINVEGCPGVTRQAVIGSSDIIRRSPRETILDLWVGETSVSRRERLPQNLFLRVHFDRTIGHMVR